MRYKDDRKLGDVIQELIGAYHLSDKLNEMNVRKFWITCLGDTINKHTPQLYINKRKLFVKVDSAALRNELVMAKSRLLESINQHAGRSIIDEIVIR